MRRVLSAVVGAALILAMVPAAAGAALPASFSGTWTSIDVFDGSVQFLSIAKGAKPTIVLVDTYASYCATHGAPSSFFTGSGTGTFKSGTQLTVSMGKAACGSFKVPLSIFAGLKYTYAAGPNTLTDSFGVTWHPYRAAARHVAGNFVGTSGDPVLTGMFLFEVNAGPTGALQSGYYTFNAMTGSTDWNGNRTQATVDTIRFFTAASGAPAAEFTGWECLLVKAPTGTDPVGTCSHYRIIVTDGASVGQADTFCGGKADVTDPNAALYCPYVWKVDKGDIRIYSGA